MAFNSDNVDLSSLSSVTDDDIEDNDLPLAFEEAVKVNPDEHAKVVDLSKRSGLPADVVKMDIPQTESDVKKSEFDFTGLRERSPVTFEHLSTFDNAVIAQDDTGVMESIEALLRPAGNAVEYTARSLAAGVPGGITGPAYGALESVTDLVRKYTTTPLRDLRVLPADPLQVASEFFRTARAESEKLSERLAPEPSGTLLDAVGGGLQSVPASAMSLLTMNPTMALNMMAGLAFGASAGEGKDQGLSPEMTAAKAVVDAVVERTTEMIPATRLLGDLGDEVTSFANTLWNQMVREVPGEQLATLGQDFNSWLFLPDNKDKTLLEFVNERPDAALNTLISTVVATGVQTSAIAGVHKGINALNKDQEGQESKSQNEQRVLDGLNDLSVKSKLKGRSEESFKQFIDQAAGDDSSHVFIDSTQVSLYLQTKTPDEIQSDDVLQLLSEQIIEARDAQSDIQLPISEFVTTIAGTEHFDQLRDSMTLSQDTIAPFRQEQAKQETESYLDMLMSDAQDRTSEYVEAQEVWQTINLQLADTGRYSEQESDTQASLATAYLGVKSRQMGVGIRELFDQSGLNISGPLTGERARLDGEQVLLQDDTLENLITEFDGLFPEGTYDSETFQSVFDAPVEQRQQRLLEVTGLDKDAAWTPERLGRVIQENARVQGDTDTRVAFVNPADFVNATHSDPQVIAEEAGELDLETLQGEEQTPFIWIGDEGQIVAHEGRHRLAALAKAGVGRVPIQVRWMSGTDFADTQDESRSFNFKGQGFETGAGLDLKVDESYLALAGNEKVIQDAMAQSDIVFQTQRVPVDQTESPEFKEWSGGGEVVESEDINDHDFKADTPTVVKVFHGTTHDFSVFDAEKGNIESQFGAINYFTSSEQDASDNYAGEGPDLTSRIDRRAEQLEDEIQEVIDDEGLDAAVEQFIPSVDQFVEDASDIAQAMAREELSGGQDQTMDLFVRVDNPFVIGENAEWIEFVDNDEVQSLAIDRVAEDQDVSVEEINENLEEYEDQIDEVRWEIQEEQEHPLIEAIQTVANRNGVEASSLAGEVYELGESATPETIEQLIRGNEEISYAEHFDTGELIQSQMIAEIIKEMGFDSIILKDAERRFSTMNIVAGTAHVHIFDSGKTNIKSATDNTGSFDPADPNIFAQPVGQPGRESFFQTDVAQRNGIGLYSAVEKAVINLNLPQWKKKKKPDTSDQNTLALKIKRTEELLDPTRDQELTQMRHDLSLMESYPGVSLDNARLMREVENSPISSSADPRYPEWSEAVKQYRKTLPTAKGKAVWEKLRKEQGVKQEELEWIGVEEFLIEGESFTREEVVEFIRGNGIHVDETVAGESSDDVEVLWNDPEVWDDPEAWDWRIDELVEDVHEEAIEALTESEKDYIESNKDEDESVEDFLDREFSSEIEDKAREIAEERAQAEHEDNPIFIQHSQNHTLLIFGNDDQGYDVRTTMHYRDVVASDIWSLSEAVIQAEGYLRENDLITVEGDESVVKWEEYITEGDYSEYRELKLKLPNLPHGDDFYYDTHFEDANIVAFLRVTDRDLPDGVDTGETHDVEFRIIDNPVSTAVVKRVVDVYDKETGETLHTFGVNEGEAQSQGEADYLDQLRQIMLDSQPGKRVGSFLSTGDGRLKSRPTEKKAYFIDEFQSDWHQQGRQQGYAPNIDIAATQAEIDTFKENVAVPLVEDVRQLYNGLINQSAPITPDQEGNNADLLFNKGAGVDGGMINDWDKSPFVDEFIDKIQKSLIIHGEESLQQRLSEYRKQVPKYTEMVDAIDAQREGVPDAPFKGNNWISLGLKRAIIDAVDNNYDAVAWADANVLADRWSDRYIKLYETQYDTKMPSIVKKLTGQKPVHLDMDGDPHEDQEEGYWVIPITDELRERVKRDAFPLFQDQVDEGKVRGYYDPANSSIRLTESANLSTFLHEFAHFMYEMELSTGSETVQSINNWFKRNADDVAKEANSYLGKKFDALKQGDVKEPKKGSITADDVTAFLDQTTTGDKSKDAAIRRAVHEQFARGFETYLMEGKAPSVELRNAFRTFARWLTQVYKDIRGRLNVNLDDQMREVFDRLLATEDQIQAAEARARFAPMFTDAASAGMTDDEFTKYQQHHEKVKDIQAETLRDKIIKQLTRQTKTWWIDEKQVIIDDEMESLKNEPVHAARARLRSTDDEVIVKLDHATVKEMVGESRTDTLGRTSVHIPAKLSGMTAKGQKGVHPDEAAAFFGYSSGSALLNDLVNEPLIKDQAESNAQERMIDRHGDILNDGSIEREADEAVHNEERGRLILRELKTLARNTSVPYQTDSAAIKSLAEERIGKLSFREIHPGKYRKAEIKAAQESATLFAEGNTEGAAEAKLRQVMNYHLGTAASNARNDTLKIVDRMKRYGKKTVREEIQKSDGGHWEQIVKILNRFEFRKSATLTQVESLNLWVRDRINTDGDSIVLSDKTLDESFVTHWKNISFSDLQGISDSVKNIEHVARYANKITRDQEELDFKTLVDRLVKSADEKVTTRFKTVASVADKPGKAEQWGRWMMGQMTKIPYMMSWMDGGDRTGVWNTAVTLPMTEAYDKELKLWESVAKPVMDAINDRSKDDRKRHNRKVFIPEIAGIGDHTGNLMGHEIIAVALNTGNASNLRKLLLGEGWADPDTESDVNFDNVKLQAVLSHMTQSDWQLVQTIWDRMELLYPQLAEVHRRTTGLVPPKVEATPITVNGVTLRGGYYPVKYDAGRDHRASLNEERADAETESMFSNGASIHASVTTGATNERTGYYAPIRLSLNVVPSHFQETIHYITHHDAVREVNKLIRNKQVAQTIKEKLGPEEYAQLRPWLNDVAKDGREAPSKMFWDSVFQRLRFGVTLGAMGFKASTGIIQISGLNNSIAELGVGPVRQAVRTILASESTMRDAWDFAKERSSVLSHRAQTMDREIKNAMHRLENKRGPLAAAQEASMKHIALIQTYAVDLPTWHAAYIKELDESGDEQKAIQRADWTIENIQGSGATKDLPKIMRNQTETGRMFTMFMTFFSSLWNQQRDLVKGTRSGIYSRTNVAAKLMFMITLPVLFEMLMRGELSEDEDEDEDERLQKMLLNTALYPVQSVPFVRDLVNAFTGDFGYNISPLQAIIEQGTRTIPKLIKIGFTDEEITVGLIKGSTKFIGAAAGIPGTGQAWATGEHLIDVAVEGEELTAHQLIFGPKR